MRWSKRKAELDALREKHGRDRSLARSFPDLSVEPRGTPCTNGFGHPTPLKQLPADAKQFPVANHHKQGLELLLPSEIKFVGKKP